MAELPRLVSAISFSPNTVLVQTKTGLHSLPSSQLPAVPNQSSLQEAIGTYPHGGLKLSRPYLTLLHRELSLAIAGCHSLFTSIYLCFSPAHSLEIATMENNMDNNGYESDNEERKPRTTIL